MNQSTQQTVDVAVTMDEFALLEAWREEKKILKAIPEAYRFEIDVDPQRILARLSPKHMSSLDRLRALFLSRQQGRASSPLSSCSSSSTSSRAARSSG